MNPTLQLNIDYSRKARDLGMLQAEHHANQVEQNWSEKAFEFLKGYIKTNLQFMTEDLRFASQGKVPSPPSQRAWGGVVRKAAIQGLIKQNGFDKTKNINAHRTPAAVWRVVKDS